MRKLHKQAKSRELLAAMLVLLLLAVSTFGLADIVQVNTFDELKNAASNPNATVIQIMTDIKVTETVRFTMNSENLIITSFSETNADANYSVSWDANSGIATSRLFLFQSNDGTNMDVTLNSLSLTGGEVNGGGGAIKVIGDVTITNCTFSDNIANFGGAVYVTGNATIENSKFDNNKANFDGGAVCVFNDDASNPSQVSILNSDFSGNMAVGEGGALAILIGDLNIDNSSFTGNTASTGGGVSIIQQGDVTVDGSTFEKNTATYEGDDYGGGGGAIFNQEGDISISNSEFNLNEALYGGGIYTSNGNTEIIDSSFVENTAKRGGGAAYLSNHEDNEIVIKGSEFNGNEALEGGALYFYTGEASIEGSTFTDNTADVGGAIRNGATTTIDSFDGFTSNEDIGNETHGIETVGEGKLNMKAFFDDDDDANEDDGENGNTGNGGNKDSTNRSSWNTTITGRGSYATGGNFSSEKQYEQAVIRAPEGYANAYEKSSKDAMVIGRACDGEIVSLAQWNSGETMCRVFYNNNMRIGWVEGKYIVPIK